MLLFNFSLSCNTGPCPTQPVQYSGNLQAHPCSHMNTAQYIHQDQHRDNNFFLLAASMLLNQPFFFTLLFVMLSLRSTTTLKVTFFFCFYKTILFCIPTADRLLLHFNTEPASIFSKLNTCREVVAYFCLLICIFSIPI